MSDGRMEVRYSKYPGIYVRGRKPLPLVLDFRQLLFGRAEGT